MNNPSRTIALDLDSTLTASLDAVLEMLYDDGVADRRYTRTAVTDWYWGQDRFGFEPWVDAFAEIWRRDPLAVDPLERDVARVVDDLHGHGVVDVVTAHAADDAVTAGKRRWLEHHEIPYREFVTVDVSNIDGSKLAMGYDWYIDDHPELAATAIDITTTDRARDAHTGTDAVHVFVRSQPYNIDAPGRYTRVETLSAVHPSAPTFTHA